MNQLIGKCLFGYDVLVDEVLVILDEFVNIVLVGFIIVFYCYCVDLKLGDLGMICLFGVGYLIGSVVVQKL